MARLSLVRPKHQASHSYAEALRLAQKIGFGEKAQVFYDMDSSNVSRDQGDDFVFVQPTMDANGVFVLWYRSEQKEARLRLVPRSKAPYVEQDVESYFHHNLRTGPRLLLTHEGAVSRLGGGTTGELREIIYPNRFGDGKTEIQLDGYAWLTVNVATGMCRNIYTQPDSPGAPLEQYVGLREAQLCRYLLEHPPIACVSAERNPNAAAALEHFLRTGNTDVFVPAGLRVRRDDIRGAVAVSVSPTEVRTTIEAPPLG